MIGEGSIPSDGVSLGSVVGARDGLRVGTVMKSKLNLTVVIWNVLYTKIPNDGSLEGMGVGFRLGFLVGTDQ